MIPISKVLFWKQWEDEDWYPYVLPFCLFMLFTVIGSTFPRFSTVMYMHKVTIVGWLIWSNRARVDELKWSKDTGDWVIGIVAGIVALVIWVAPEEIFKVVQGDNEGFNPFTPERGIVLGWAVAIIRLVGASFVVPTMEELFWRSFIMRWIIDKEFLKVNLGHFTWFAFLGTSICFAFEHQTHRIGVGIVAGMIYAGLLVWKKRLFIPILAHTVTNLGLGIYVIMTDKYYFW